MAQKFKSGQTVKLISGSPNMTVSRYMNNGSGPVICQWFVKDNELKDGEFEEDSLELVDTQKQISPPKFLQPKNSN